MPTGTLVSSQAKPLLAGDCISLDKQENSKMH